ncbi:DUF4007 family protein (plasmid) [Picosynechococcus sp. PCC 11901]|uniref:DUF4007 family protein n=1 Tax=Picosynechococcus sp. PCC 11901 TaxID=2579791 RepID=UPI0010FC0D21|nr:DUF4007 family protein [Picosynechococcus sp. PCC 11901]QCS48137.1 DUF4007 family protein [Picosynechococcus sp. PCC 11901]
MPEIILYAALHFCLPSEESARTIPLGSLLYDQGSPGKVFKLTESALCAAIENISQKI